MKHSGAAAKIILFDLLIAGYSNLPHQLTFT